MNLFALTTHPEARLLRLNLSAELQREVATLFERQYQTFTADVVDLVPFDGRYAPESGELLAIERFTEAEPLRAAAGNPLSVDVFDPSRHALESVKALFMRHLADGAERLLLQSFERRRLIDHKGLALFFSGGTFQRLADAGLMLDNRLLAVIEGESLRFKSFHLLRRVFDLSGHFNEATHEEVSAFAAHEKLAVYKVPEFVAAAGPMARKKITLIQASGVLDKLSAEQLTAAARPFNLAIQTTPEGRIVLPENKTDLRRLLRFLDEDYYQSTLSQTNYVSNSKRVAD